TREAYYQALERSGVKMETLRSEFKRQIILEKTIDSVIKEQTVSEDAVLDFYNVMKGLLFSKPKGYTYDLIEVSVDKTARELQERVAANVEKWMEIVSEDEFSSDIVRITTEPLFFSEISISNDKDLSFMINLGIGEVGPVAVVSSNDYMIAIKREVKEESEMPFDDVSFDIRMMLEQQRQRGAVEKFRSDLKARAVVEIYDHSIFPAPAAPVNNDVIETLSPDEQKTDTPPEVSPEIKPEPGADAVAPEEKTPEEVVPEQKTDTPPDVPIEVKPEQGAGAVVPEEKTPEEVVPEQKTDIPPDVPIEVKPDPGAGAVVPEEKTPEPDESGAEIEVENTGPGTPEGVSSENKYSP
ncbi:MAG: hypothetical protein FWG09_04955, partial [Synergistaceae bacterium]|nr:hypothetical protein [Synergistaceae bacterium]